METKLSPSRSASFWAFLMACSAVRDNCGCCTRAAGVDGQGLDGGAGLDADGIRVRPGGAEECDGHALALVHQRLEQVGGFELGIPAVEAFMAAAARASWLLVVNLASKESSFREHAGIKVECTPLNFASGPFGSMFADGEMTV